MENLDVIILSGIACAAFLTFIIASLKEFSKMEKEGYVHNPQKPKFGRDAIFNLLENLFDDKVASKKDKAKLIKTIDRTIADMESDGLRFSNEAKEKLEKERQELFCEYSGLPSVKAYSDDE